MTPTKAQIVENIRSQTSFTKGKSFEIVETLMEFMKKSLEKGEDVLISGFGKFSVNRKEARNGRNPATGDSMILDLRRVVTVKCSGKRKSKIDGS
jgi:integration host factor subunit alpha